MPFELTLLDTAGVSALMCSAAPPLAWALTAALLVVGTQAADLLREVWAQHRTAIGVFSIALVAAGRPSDTRAEYWHGVRSDSTASPPDRR